MNMDKADDISKWRARIDELDLELIRLLNERAQCAIEIGKVKRIKNLPIYDPSREENVVRMMLESNNGPLDEEGVRRLFERIIDESRRIERVTAERKKRRSKRTTGT
jgi:chorismate mutase